MIVAENLLRNALNLFKNFVQMQACFAAHMLINLKICKV